MNVLVNLVIFCNAHIQNIRVQTIFVWKITLLPQPLMNFNQMSMFVISIYCFLYLQWPQKVIRQPCIGACLALTVSLLSFGMSYIYIALMHFENVSYLELQPCLNFLKFLKELYMIDLSTLLKLTNDFMSYNLVLEKVMAQI